MKRTTAVLAAALTLSLVRSAAAAVAGSKHDFTATGGYPITGVTEQCKSCHIPHQPLINTPLWAHSLSTYTYNLYNTNAAYTGPNSAAYDASPVNLSTTKSGLCLSCHDGTVAVAGTTFIQTTSPNWVMWDAGAAVGGQGSVSPSNGMKGSHPIAVNYATVRTNQAANYNDISTNANVKLDATGKVQCTSCHNPHNLAGTTRMLVMSNTGSALCLACHNR